jgi:hypothetical protein
MTSTTSPAPAIDDAQLLAQLTSARDAAQSELAELEPRRVALSARVDSLSHTIAVLNGETPPAPTSRRRASSSRSTTPRATTPASDEPTATFDRTLRALRAAIKREASAELIAKHRATLDELAPSVDDARRAKLAELAAPAAA